MTEDHGLDATTLTERVVLLGVADLTARGADPAHSGAVVSACSNRLADVDGDVLGHLTESDVIRALNRLEAAGLVTETVPDDPSPVGKGRPRYELGPGPEVVLDSLAGDDRLARAVDGVRTRRE